MVAKRIIPCLDVKDGAVVKGINFEGLREVGDAVAMGVEYSRQGADELVYLDISASKEARSTFTKLVERIALGIDIPFTVGGGIGSLDDAARRTMGAKGRRLAEEKYTWDAVAKFLIKRYEDVLHARA